MATPTSRSHRGSINVTSDPRTLINIKYSNIPVNVPTLYPSSVKRKEGTLEIFGNLEMRESEPFVPKGKTKYAEIKKNDQQDAVDLILKTTQHMDKTNQSKKKKGSMYISELWGSKHYKGIMKDSKLEEAYETKRKAEQEELSHRLERLEKAYEKREFQMDDIDSKKMLEQFMTGGLNSPHLTVHRKSPLKGERGRSVDVKVQKTETSESEDSDTLPQIKGNSSFSAVTADLLKKIQGPDSKRKSLFYQKSCNESIDSERSSKKSSCEREPKTSRPVKSLFHMQSPRNRVIIKSSKKQVSIDIDELAAEKSPKGSLKVDSLDRELNKSTEPTSILNFASFRIKTEQGMSSLPTETDSLSANRGVSSPKQTNFKPQFLRVKAASTRTLQKNLKTLY